MKLSLDHQRRRVGGVASKLGIALVALLVVACETEAPVPQGGAHAPHTGHVEVVLEGDRAHNALTVLDGAAAAAAAMSSGELRLAPDEVGEVFWRTGLRFETAGGVDPQLEYRVERDGQWSEWSQVEVIWHEGVAFNGRIQLDAPAQRMAVRPQVTADAAQLTFVLAELFPEPLTVREAPAVTPGDGRYATLEQGLAPPSFVNLRSAWGARSTGTCGSAHTPTYLTVHHTVGPTNDSMTPEQRMRQIQNYHIDNNGWCDIGYHFVVSADGRIWQGRASHDRSGAHVGGHNSNNVGVSFMGSFHIDQVPDAMISGTAPLFAWFRDNYNLPLTRHERVFGHKEWSGQSTACPGGYLLPRIQEIIDQANGASAKDEVVDVAVKWRTISGQDRNFVGYGSSASIFDMLIGQKVVGILEVRNGVDRPATDDMVLGYWIQDPYLVPLSYKIQTDKAVKDGATFADSDQNGRSDNPPASGPPAEGFVRVGVVQPGETVRVLFTLEARRYSIGKVDHPDLRGWVKHIGNYYGEQDSWNDDIEHNDAGKKLRAYAQLDIFSQQEWGFDGGNGEDVEGWRHNADVDWLAVNTTDNAMAYRATGADPYVTSPAWTLIDADVHEQIVVRGRQHGGARTAQLFWAHEGESFAEERSLEFDVPGDGQFDVFELDLGGLPGWSGAITRLRLDAWNGGPYDGAASWFDVDYVMAVDTGVAVIDGDSDGSASDVDCNDADATIHPGADEVCDGVDNDCNGEVDEAGACQEPGDTSSSDISDAASDVSLPDGGPNVGEDTSPDGGGGGEDTGDGQQQADPDLSLGDASGGCCTTVRAAPERSSSPLGTGAGLLAGLVLIALGRRRRRRRR